MTIRHIDTDMKNYTFKKPDTSLFFRSLVAIIFLITSFTTVSADSTTKTSSVALELRQELKDHLHTLDTIVDRTDSGDNIPLEDRVVVVTFFASWCPPCLKEFAALNSILNKLGEDNVTIVAVNVFEEFDNNDATRMVNFLDTTQPEFMVLKGTDVSRELFGNINRIPTLLVFDQSGDLAFNFIHAQGADKHSQTVGDEELLGVITPLL